MRVLVLDLHYQPVSTVDWTKAITLIFMGRAEILEESEFVVRSATNRWKVPSVIRYIKTKVMRRRKVAFTRENVFIRDRFQCQYCGNHRKYKDLTFDHVKPLTQGGATSWDNITTACKSCNVKKAGRTPEQARMPLLSNPAEPKHTHKFVIRLVENYPEPWVQWLREQNE